MVSNLFWHKFKIFKILFFKNQFLGHLFQLLDILLNFDRFMLKG
jgi:hypothetical protein